MRPPGSAAALSQAALPQAAQQGQSVSSLSISTNLSGQEQLEVGRSVTLAELRMQGLKDGESEKHREEATHQSSGAER